MIDPRTIDLEALPIVVWEGVFGIHIYRVVIIAAGDPLRPAVAIERKMVDALSSAFWLDVTADSRSHLVASAALMSIAATGSPLNAVPIAEVSDEPEPEPELEAEATTVVSTPKPDHYRAGMEAAKAGAPAVAPDGLTAVEQIIWINGHKKGGE